MTSFFRVVAGFLIVMLSSCAGVKDDSPAVVRFDYLVQAYKSDPTNATIAYNDRRVVVAVTTYTISGDDILVHVGPLSEPAVLVFRFLEKPKDLTGIIWIYGKCVGRTWDGKIRGTSDYRFFVTVVDCQIGPPPTMPTF